MVTKGQSGRGLCVVWAARNWSLAEAATSAVERTSAFDGIGRCVTRVVGRLVRSGPVKDLLAVRGCVTRPTLCSPTSPSAWSSSRLLDMLGGSEGRRASDTLVAVGVVAALPTAIIELSDLADVEVAAMTEMIEIRRGLVGPGRDDSSR